tara:strand:- start:174 stop:314 length:141 start_codon:yes stop_codon:yes gene_type:complete
MNQLSDKVIAALRHNTGTATLYGRMISLSKLPYTGDGKGGVFIPPT